MEIGAFVLLWIFDECSKESFLLILETYLPFEYMYCPYETFSSLLMWMLFVILLYLSMLDWSLFMLKSVVDKFPTYVFIFKSPDSVVTSILKSKYIGSIQEFGSTL